MDIQEVRRIAQQIVDESKRTARVEQGTLKRSISYTVKSDEVVFREMDYGQYGDNSQLIENAKRLMPNGSRYKFEFEDVDGNITEITKTIHGRTSKRTILKQLQETKSKNALALINSIRKRNEKRNGKADN